MKRIVRCSEDDYEALVGIWGRSVIATHSFLIMVEKFGHLKK